MRRFLLLGIVICAGCGGTGGGGAEGTKGTNPPPALTINSADNGHFIDFRGANKNETNVSATVHGDGTITVSSATGGLSKLKLTLNAPCDLSLDDILYVPMVATPSSVLVGVGNSYEISLFEGAAERATVHWDGSPAVRLQGIPRDQRDQVTAVELRWIGPAGQDILIGGVYGSGVWLSLPTDFDPGGIFPDFRPLVYEATYFNSTTLSETPPVLQATIPGGVGKQSRIGMRVLLKLENPDHPTYDKVRFYRVVTEGSVTTKYRLGEAPNIGTPSVVDRWPLDIVKTFPTG